jgi:hypothetical protein
MNSYSYVILSRDSSSLRSELVHALQLIQGNSSQKMNQIGRGKDGQIAKAQNAAQNSYDETAKLSRGRLFNDSSLKKLGSAYFATIGRRGIALRLECSLGFPISRCAENQN